MFNSLLLKSLKTSLIYIANTWCRQVLIRILKLTYLIGEQLTLADVYLWPTLIRFEAVYQCLFKANKYQLDSYKNLYRYMLHLLDNPQFASTLDVDYIKQHYFFSFKVQNPTGIVPVGPVLPWL